MASPADAPAVRPKAKTRSELADASQRHGFALVAERRDEFASPVAFGVDFEAMDAHWPVQRDRKDERRLLLDKMNELAHGQIETLVATRFLFRKRD
jgi:hypothetical protein